VWYAANTRRCGVATHATIPVDHETKARFIRYVAEQQVRSGRRVTHSAAINQLLDVEETDDGWDTEDPSVPDSD
jgi:hypothetical protein